MKDKKTISPEDLQLTFKYDDIKLDGNPYASALPHQKMQEAVHELIGPSGYWIDHPLETRGTLYRTSSGEVIADAHLKGEVRFRCVSCSAEHTQKIQFREDWVIVPQNHESAQEEDVQGQGALDMTPDLYTFEGSELKLVEIYREALILSLSLHPRCEDLGQVCTPRQAESIEEAIEIDPRLAPLLAIRDALAKEEN